MREIQEYRMIILIHIHLLSVLRFSAMASVDLSDAEKPEQISIDDWGLFDAENKPVDNSWLDEKIEYLNSKKSQVHNLVTSLKSVIKVRF